MGARHVVCAYSIPGRNFHINQSYCSDDEHKMGNVLLGLLEEANITNRALFVGRTYDGEHIGPDRFNAFKKAAKSAVNRSSFNQVTGRHQCSWPQDGWHTGTGKQVTYEKPGEIATGYEMGEDESIDGDSASGSTPVEGRVAENTQANDNTSPEWDGVVGMNKEFPSGDTVLQTDGQWDWDRWDGATISKCVVGSDHGSCYETTSDAGESLCSSTSERSQDKEETQVKKGDLQGARL